MANQLEEKLKDGFKNKVKNTDGYFSKVMKKMIDNLQVKIHNIHIRIENKNSEIGNMR